MYSYKLLMKEIFNYLRVILLVSIRFEACFEAECWARGRAAEGGGFQRSSMNYKVVLKE